MTHLARIPFQGYVQSMVFPSLLSAPEVRPACGVCRRQAGFSLTELLVVIAIISLLAAMLVPAITMVRKAAAQTAASSSVRQLGLGVMLYTNDNDGFFPGPLYQGLNITYKTTQPFYIGSFIWSYLDSPQPSATQTYELSGLRDRYREKAGGFSSFSAGTTYWVRNPWYYPGGMSNVANPTASPGISFDPCGYWGSTAANQNRQYTISQISHPADYVFVQDPSSTNYVGDPALAPTPFYKKYITLYYDGHVGTMASAFNQLTQLW